ncbi:MAG TPA: hypothetical protein PL033_07785 [Candidatus Brocadiia bacterium]|nr:hypothetical protein [Candidatus Brocadiia bacterium]
MLRVIVSSGVLAAIFGGFLTGSGAIRGDDPDVAFYISVFDPLAVERARETDWEQKDGGSLAWGESYFLSALVAAYEASGDARYLDILAERGARIFEIRDDKRGKRDEIRDRIMPAWVSKKYSKGKDFAWIVHAGMITHPLARFVRIVRRDPALREKYGAIADAFLTSIEETVAGFEPCWRGGPNKGEGYYFGDFLGKHLPLNQQNAMGRTLVILWQTTGKEQYFDKAAKLAGFFRNRIRVSGDPPVFDWSYWADLDGPGKGSEDISHASINVDFAIICHGAGIVFTREDMDAMCRTFMLRVSKGGNLFANCVNGSGEGKYDGAVARWTRLAWFDPEIGRVAQNYMASRDWKGGEAMLGAANLALVRATAFKSSDKPLAAGQ